MLKCRSRLLPIPGQAKLDAAGLPNKEYIIMKVFGIALVLLVAVEHLYFLYLEMFLWTTPRVRFPLFFVFQPNGIMPPISAHAEC